MTAGATAVLLAVCGVGAETFVFPRVQAVPLDGRQCAFEIDGVEAARYHYANNTPKPYIFPLIGPAGRRLTSVSHPVDPKGHRHHRSIWIGHHDVNGVSFWAEDGGARIVSQGIEAYQSGAESAALTMVHPWLGPDGQPLMTEKRTLTVHRLPGGESYLDLVCTWTPAGTSVMLGKTPFGFLGVRVADTMAVRGGGGSVRNAEGEQNETGVHWKRSRWVDYTGPVAPDETNGIAFFDHPDNPHFPTYFHVRDEGWMGAAFCYEEPYALEPGASLTLRYRLYTHGAEATPEDIERHWKVFAVLDENLEGTTAGK